jgi:hypothetical protein
LFLGNAEQHRCPLQMTARSRGTAKLFEADHHPDFDPNSM